MRVFLAAMLIAGAASPAAVEKWYYVSDRDGLLVLADADSVQQSGEAVAVLGFFGSGEPLNVVGDPPVVIWYWITQFEFLCSSDRYRATRLDSYNQLRVLEFSSNHSEAWAPVPAKSLAYDLRNFACDGVGIAPVGDPFDFTDEIFFSSDE